MWSKLGDNDLVVQFQNFCGLKWKNNDEFVNYRQNSKETSPNSKETKPLNEKWNSQNSLLFEYNILIHTLFHLCSALGDEQVLISLLSFVLWNVDEKAFIRVYLSLAISIYLGQYAKDTFLESRPLSPPVIRVPQKYVDEYSMPSTHAMIGVVMPFSLIYFTTQRYQENIHYVFIITAIYSSFVAASRVYLGMHYVKDVLYGMLFEIIIMIIVLPLLKDMPIEEWCRTSPNTSSIAVLAAVLLLKLYPTSSELSYNTFSDTALVLGAVTGAFIGIRYSADNDKIMLEFIGKSKEMSLVILLTYYIGRFAIGTTILAITRVMSKWMVTRSLSMMLPKHMTETHLDYRRHVEIPHKVITYCLVSISGICLAPKIFIIIHRF